MILCQHERRRLQENIFNLTLFLIISETCSVLVTLSLELFKVWSRLKITVSSELESRYVVTSIERVDDWTNIANSFSM